MQGLPGLISIFIMGAHDVWAIMKSVKSDRKPTLRVKGASPMNWDALLQEGEVLRWEGRPTPRCFTFRNWKHSVFGILLLLVCVYWQAMAFPLSRTYDAGFLVWIPFPFVLVALYLCFGHLLLARLEWERVFYALTDRRILVRRGLFRPRVEEMDVAALTWFRLSPQGRDLGTLRVRAEVENRDLVLSCIEYPRKVTDLLEERLVGAKVECPLSATSAPE